MSDQDHINNLLDLLEANRTTLQHLLKAAHPHQMCIYVQRAKAQVKSAAQEDRAAGN
jgi:hypothetical protein